jgi:hypothetical protein
MGQAGGGELCGGCSKGKGQDAPLEIDFIASLVPLLPYTVTHRAALGLAGAYKKSSSMHWCGLIRYCIKCGQNRNQDGEPRKYGSIKAPVFVLIGTYIRIVVVKKG